MFLVKGSRMRWLTSIPEFHEHPSRVLSIREYTAGKLDVLSHDKLVLDLLSLVQDLTLQFLIPGKVRLQQFLQEELVWYGEGSKKTQGIVDAVDLEQQYLKCQNISIK